MNDFMTNITSTFSYTATLMPALLRGAVVTVELFFLTLLLSLPLGLPFALGSKSKFWPFKAFCRAYVWLFRGTPLILQLFFFYFFLPIAFPELKIDAFPTAVITFVLNYAAYFAEIYRAGIESIDRGQHEAAKSLGVSKSKTLFDIILPQAFKRVLPPISNEAITLIKDTALVSVISVGELMKASYGAANRDVNTTAYLIAALIYLLFTFLLTMLSTRLEKHFSKHEAKGE